MQIWYLGISNCYINVICDKLIEGIASNFEHRVGGVICIFPYF
jgi:hypothetical protein